MKNIFKTQEFLEFIKIPLSPRRKNNDWVIDMKKPTKYMQNTQNIFPVSLASVLVIKFFHINLLRE